MSEEKMSKHVYKMNPPCPHCGEEHIWWRRRIPLKYEEKMYAWYAEHPTVSDFETLLQKAPVFVPQSFTCPCCGKDFAYDMGLRRMDRTDWYSKDFLPVGEVRVFDD